MAKTRTVVITLIGVASALNYHYKNYPNSEISRTINTIASHPRVIAVRASVAQKASDFIRAQGEALTDKVAEKIKEQLFAPREVKIVVQGADGQNAAAQDAAQDAAQSEEN